MATRQKILIIDNEVSVAERTALYLNKEFFDTMIASDLQTALKLLENADLVILEAAPAAMNTQHVCRRIRSMSRVPLIILSENSDIFDRVLCLEIGADDYLTKPFDDRELAARIRALLRRSTPSYYQKPLNDSREPLQDLRCIEYPGLTINLGNYSVFCDGNRMEMPPKEIELLYFLASSPNQVFTREQLLSHIWGYDFAGDTRTVDVHIKRLREKLRTHEHWSISTVWGVGYQFRTR